jgi:myosin heavy subunit
MEEKREPLSEMAIERKIQILRNKHMDSEVIALVKSDYEYGLTDDEIGLYLNKSYDIEQMKVLSKCLHKGVSEALLTLLKDSRMAAPKMQTALDYYEKGVPIDAIREVVQKDDTAVNMRRMFDVVLEKLNKAKEQVPQDLEYVKALISQMDEVVAKINHQNERYDALNKKLSEIETSKDDEEVRERLVKENQDKDALINSQQNELNKASSTIARLRDDIEKKDKEMKRMSERIESLEDKIIGIATDNMKAAEVKNDAGKTENAEDVADTKEDRTDKKTVDTVAVPQNMQAVANGIPVYYQIPVVDGTGNVVQRLPIERSVRKSSNSGVASLFARLSFKKRSRADIVKLVASGDLVPAQLVQIKSAIEKGLTESQLVELINNNISAEKMKEIIEIAVLENSMAD